MTQETEPRGLHVVAGGKGPQAGKLFEELALPVLDRLYQFACRLESDPQKAEDLLQEALLIGFRKFHQLKNPKAFHAWTGRILRHTFLNQQTTKKSQESRLVSGTPPEQGRPVADEKPYEPERRLLARGLSCELKAALDQLPQEQRLAVLLIDVQGIGYADAATMLEVAPGTVASRVSRGRAVLRRALGHLARERGWVES